MTRWRNRRTVALTLISVVCLAVVGFSLVPRNKPLHKGKSVREWIELACEHDSSSAREETKAIGAAAVPGLIEKLHFKDTAIRRGRSWLREHAPMFISGRLEEVAPVSEVRKRAAFTLGTVGKEARPAVPHLIGMLSNSQSYSEEVVTALGNIGPDASAALPVLRSLLETKPPFEQVYIAQAIANIQQDTAGMMPVFIRLASQSQDDGAAMNAALMFMMMGPKARPAAPVLRSMLSETNRSRGTRGNAALALGNIGDRDEKTFKTLLAGMKDPNAHVAGNCARSLCSLDPSSATLQQSIPAFQAFVNDWNAKYTNHPTTLNAHLSAIGLSLSNSPSSSPSPPPGGNALR